jgi:hypothetical protein
MVPSLKDARDVAGMFRWFFRRGPRPMFDRYSYMEKFDYWAVFWGIAIIGGSGLLLWFPIFFSRFLPGWIFNVATIVHGDEALLAMGFIFTIHFSSNRPEVPDRRVISRARAGMKDSTARTSEHATGTRARKPMPDGIPLVGHARYRDRHRTGAHRTRALRCCDERAGRLPRHPRGWRGVSAAAANTLTAASAPHRRVRWW